jgi:hypothetical protein
MKLSSRARVREFSSVLAAAIMLLATLTGGRAAELVMFEQPGCPWCATFNREVAAKYGKSDEGKRAPLRRVDITGPLPPDLSFIKIERLTPLFVLVDGGREIGRIRGYPGEDHFWGLLDMMIDHLDQAAPVKQSDQIFNASPLSAAGR